MSLRFGDVNPPVHAWACWRVYKMTGRRGARDRLFLARVFQKLLINFTWWVNRKDVTGKHLFAGGFLGLDNISLFDRSKPLPSGAVLEQADGTAWMAFYCVTMLAMALELAAEDPAYEDVASKFFEHFVAIADAMNYAGRHRALGRTRMDSTTINCRSTDKSIRLRIRSLVGIIPLFAVEVLDDKMICSPARFSQATAMVPRQPTRPGRTNFLRGAARPHAATAVGLLAIPSRPRLERMLRYVLDENEFLSPFGVRSLSRVHKDSPTRARPADVQRVEYEPGESSSDTVRRQLELARAGLVPGELSVGRGPGAIPSLLRRHVAGRMSRPARDS